MSEDLEVEVTTDFREPFVTDKLFGPRSTNRSRAVAKTREWFPGSAKFPFKHESRSMVSICLTEPMVQSQTVQTKFSHPIMWMKNKVSELIKIDGLPKGGLQQRQQVCSRWSILQTWLS